MAPITVITGLKVQSSLDCMFDQTAEDLPVLTCKRTPEELATFIQERAQVLSLKQKRAATALESRRRQSRSTASKGRRANFQEGDFVLMAVLNRRQVQSKISRRWMGPYRVVVVESEWIYVVENIVTDERKTAHASRLRFYHDPSLETSAELIAFAAQTGIGYAIKSIIEFRINDITGVPEVLIEWTGFEDEDSTWEPLSVIEEDAPLLIKQFSRENPQSDIGTHILSQEAGGGRYGTCP